MLSGKVSLEHIDFYFDFYLQVFHAFTDLFCFSPRFNDIHVPVRLECVKFASHCLMNHPDLAKDLTGVYPWCVHAHVCMILLLKLF